MGGINFIWGSPAFGIFNMSHGMEKPPHRITWSGRDKDANTSGSDCPDSHFGPVSIPGDPLLSSFQARLV